MMCVAHHVGVAEDARFQLDTVVEFEPGSPRTDVENEAIEPSKPIHNESRQGIAEMLGWHDLDVGAIGPEHRPTFAHSEAGAAAAAKQLIFTGLKGGMTGRANE